MRRMIVVGLLCLLPLSLTGCIAVSAKEVNAGMRYEAVSTRDGGIYVVDKECLTARRVKIVESDDCDDD